MCFVEIVRCSWLRGDRIHTPATILACMHSSLFTTQNSPVDDPHVELFLRGTVFTGVRCGDLHVKLSEFWEAEWPLAPQGSWRVASHVNGK